MSDIQTTDWLTFAPANAVGKRRAYIDLPAFSVTGLTWKGASEVVLQYNFSASSNFVLTTIPTKPTTANYGLCIRFRVGSTTYRYKLWRDDNFVLNDSTTPLYSGQVILKNFVLEVWSFNGETTADNAATYRVITGVRTVRSNLRDSADYALAVGTAFNNFGNQTAAASLYGTGSGDNPYLAARYDAASVDTGLVSTWPESINYGGTGYSLNQATSAKQPTKVAADNTLKHGYVRFDSANNYIGANGGTIGDVERDFTIYAVVNQISWSLNYVFFNWVNVGNHTYDLNLQTIAPTPNVAANTGASNDGLTVGDWHIIRLRYISATGFLYIRVDTNTETLVSLPTLATDGYDGLWFGSLYDGSLNSNFGLADFLIYNTLTQLSSAQDTQIMTYLRQQHFGLIPSPITYDSGVAWLDNP